MKIFWVVVGLLFALSMLSYVVTRISPSHDGEFTRVLDVQQKINTGGIPVARKFLAAQSCTGTCRDEFREIREALIPYEVTLTESVRTLTAVNVPAKNRGFVLEYRNVLSPRLEAVRLYLQAIDTSGNIMNQETLDLGDEKWAESQLRMGKVIDEIQKLYPPGR
ncbi:MAG: hypothetical protein EXR54_05920 [Dehalococcoidia bacterium]|nr:hypothetical protein [Dehalococcoidia bacterium]